MRSAWAVISGFYGQLHVCSGMPYLSVLGNLYFKKSALSHYLRAKQSHIALGLRCNPVHSTCLCQHSGPYHPSLEDRLDLWFGPILVQRRLYSLRDPLLIVASCLLGVDAMIHRSRSTNIVHFYFGHEEIVAYDVVAADVWATALSLAE